MVECEWIVCKGCGKTGWLDIEVPMEQTGWNSHLIHGPQDTPLNFFLCSKCDCINCSEAIITTSYDESGEKYPDIECRAERCIHILSSEQTPKEAEGGDV